jgi:hypothetical protein
MTRYTLTAEDRRKGGITTSQKYDMRARGRAGLQKFADKYFDGNYAEAGTQLSRIGNFVTDPFPANRAWSHRITELPPKLLRQLPPDLLARIWGHCETDFGPLDSF